MYISKIELSNFRNFKEESVLLVTAQGLKTCTFGAEL